MGILRNGLLGLLLITGPTLGCSSEPLDDSPTDGAAGATGAPPVYMGACRAALRQALGLVESRSQADVQVLETNGSELTLYVDASAGGIGMQDENPWVYVELGSGTRVDISDIEALESADWDLGIKRFILRSNSGDSGPGQGGALRVGLPFDSVDESTLGSQNVPTESWFDADCNLTSVSEDTNELVTTLSGWSEYDPATHVLRPAPDVTFLVRGGKGTLYKIAVVDYYATPSGTTGTVAGRYLLRVAPLE